MMDRKRQKRERKKQRDGKRWKKDRKRQRDKNIPEEEE